MKRLSRLLALFLFIFILSLSFTTEGMAQKSCSAHHFIIEDELTGEPLGDINIAFLVRGKANKVICLQGRFNAEEYRYEYYCNGDYGTWDFVRKMKNDEMGQSCFWGKIR